ASSGTISLSGSLFHVTGSHTYPSIFSFTITATIDLYTLSLHDALPILIVGPFAPPMVSPATQNAVEGQPTTFILGTFSQTPVGVPLAITVLWGGGTSTTAFSFSNGTLAATHTYAEESKFHAPNGQFYVV